MHLILSIAYFSLAFKSVLHIFYLLKSFNRPFKYKIAEGAESLKERTQACEKRINFIEDSESGF